MKDCYECEFRRHMGSKIPGCKIPDGTGKCTRPGGHCDPDIVCGKIGEGPVIRNTKYFKRTEGGKDPYP